MSSLISKKNQVYQKISQYFKNIEFTKLQNVSMNNVWYCKYIALIQCDLLICSTEGIKCCIILSPMDSRLIGEVVPLSSIRWLSFQTRIYTNNVFSDIKEQAYDKTLRNILSEKIKVYSRTNNKTTYISEENLLKVILLHTTDNTYEYTMDTTTLASALETYQCVISFN